MCETLLFFILSIFLISCCKSLGLTIPFKAESLSKNDKSRNSTFRMTAGGIAIGTLENQFDLLYVGQVGIGTPLQYFKVILDMRSHFLVVPYFTCDIPGCSGKAKYTETRTVKALPQPNTFTETFDGMQFDGICATEYITLGDPDNQQLLITDAVFHAATAISGRFGDIQADGVFGLGLNYPGDKYKTVFQTGLDQNIFVGPYITFAMFKNKKPDQKQINGVVTYGHYDKINCEREAFFLKAGSPTNNLWIIKSYKIFVNEQEMPGSFKVEIKNTYSHILLSNEMFNFLKESVKITEEKGRYFVNCMETFTFGFASLNKNVTIDSENAVLQDGDKCQLLVETFEKNKDDEIDIVFGLPLSRQYCQHYILSLKHIGFSVPKEYSPPTGPPSKSTEPTEPTQPPKGTEPTEPTDSTPPSRKTRATKATPPTLPTKQTEGTRPTDAATKPTSGNHTPSQPPATTPKSVAKLTTNFIAFFLHFVVYFYNF